jgi:hypothetical protein
MAEPALCFLTMTKMRGKFPLEKKEMYGSQKLSLRFNFAA